MIKYLPLSLAALLLASHAQAQNPITPAANHPATLKKLPDLGIPQSIVVRTSENVTKDGWVWLLNQCKSHGITRVDLMVKQDEDHFPSGRTGATLESGELLVPLPGEKTAKGWEDANWLKGMLKSAHEMDIEVWAWWPCFHDSQAAALFPKAAYSNERGEQFVDPGFIEVRSRQTALLTKLLDTYGFDGVSLDWVRYDHWDAGSKGPLGEEFTRRYGYAWNADTLKNDYAKAKWYELRAEMLAQWVGQLVKDMRSNHPGVRWGAYVLPWQFTEASQNYPMLSAAGLDFLQPMGYWRDWKREPEWVGDHVLSKHLNLEPGTAQWPAIGIEAPVEELARAMDHIPLSLCGGISWFNYATWEQKTFDKLLTLPAQSVGARRLLGYEAVPVLDPVTTAEIPPAPSTPTLSMKLPQAKNFPADATMWSVVCLAELYKRNALRAQEDNPVVPVLALHTFAEGKVGQTTFPYKNTTEYLDNMMEFIANSGFTVCPLSRLQGYLITNDAADLPPKPLIITLDDGSQSVYKLFYPRAQKYHFPFTMALVTSWLSDTKESNHSTEERGGEDPTMTWSEAKEMYSSNLMEVVSHSDGLHYQTSETPASSDEKPAEITRQFLTEYQRTETNEEYLRRIRTDMNTSRARLSNNGFRAPTIFCWPYGDWNPAAKALGVQAGFTHFLLYSSPPVFSSANQSSDGIPRLPVLRTDESIPLQFPSDPKEAQAWWLAFLKVGRDSCNISLIKATVAQLSWESQRSPEVEMSRAVMDYVRGNSASGNTRLIALRQAYPFDTAINESVNELFNQFSPAP